MKTLRSYSSLLLVFLWLPLVVICAKGLNVQAFYKLFANDELLQAFASSLLLALVAGLLAVLLASLTAFGLLQAKGKIRLFIQAGLFLPMILPEIAFGLSYLVWYAQLGFQLGWTTLVLSHVAFIFSYATLVMYRSVANLDWSLVDAATDLGASAWFTFRHALWPQLVPAVVAAFVLSFSLSLDDFLISFLVKGLDQMTLPVKVYSMMRLKIGEEIYALSLVLTLISVFSVATSQIWYITSAKTER